VHIYNEENVHFDALVSYQILALWCPC
jgi:hypothetical protein